MTSVHLALIFLLGMVYILWQSYQLLHLEDELRRYKSLTRALNEARMGR